MSLAITRDWEENRKWYREKKHFIKTYKVLRDQNISPYEEYKWKKGVNVSDRVNTDLTNYEIRENKVYKGYHLYTNKDDAYLEKTLQGSKVVECLVSPKDVVAVGRFRGRRVLVATRAFMKDEVKRRPGKKQ